MKRIAVLTSGGDASGMNSCIEILFQLCKKNDFQLIGFMYGYKGLIENKFKILTKYDVQNIFNKGGSILKTSRCDEFLKVEGKIKASENLKKDNIDCLIVIGGNGSIKGAFELSEFFNNIICIPATIDNDLGYTNQTLGFDTAVNNAVDAIVKEKQTMETNDRGLIVETMGRHCSDIATYSAVASQADLLITEKLEFDGILSKVIKIANEKTNCPLIVIKENLIDIEELSKYLQEKTNITFKTDVLGYVQRGGEPTVCDKILATELAYLAVDLIKKEVYSKSIGKCDGKLMFTDLESAAKSSEQQENKKLKEIYNDISKI
ncbi:MAG: ATP-dependent 6-phosphofructokinase [Clostridiales bacterium]|nr:ATP-dependent 6-phosphofructokinase [Candidatus Apopatousia equi]